MAQRYFETYGNDDDPAVQVVNVEEWRQQYYESEVDVGLDMTSIRTLILLEKTTNHMMFSSQENSIDENDYSLQRLSLAHERLHSIPKILLEEVAPTVKILDLSHNEFDKMDFLEEFHEITSLICDHNNLTAEQRLPFLPKLELLWMNNCKILDIYLWVYKLSSSCPNLKYLSLMGNPGAPLQLNKESKEETRYRLFVLSLFQSLRHLDDKPVTDEERKKSRKLYQKHLLEILAAKAQQNMPNYVRRMSQRLMLMVNAASGSKGGNKNFIV